MRGRGKNWLLLSFNQIIFLLIRGYSIWIYHGEKPAPELKPCETLFIDGIKLLVVNLIYATPIILLLTFAFLPFVLALIMSGAGTTDFASMTSDQTKPLDKFPSGNPVCSIIHGGSSSH